MPPPSRSDYLLDNDVVFLNHGSYGAVPRVVQDAYEGLQRAMERNPVEWLQRKAPSLLRAARGSVATVCGADADDIVFFPNPTTAINMVARSLHLQPGDEIVGHDHDYGAVQRTWTRLCREEGSRYTRVHIPLPVSTDAEFVDRIWNAVTDRTRVLFLDRITSSTALIFPVDELCRRARAAGILTIIDGAHVPGHIPLDVKAMGCDIFTGALHKWMSAPKGSTLLFARREVQARLKPLVTSWGWESDQPTDSQFVDYHEWQGTRDLSPFLAAEAAIDFCDAHDWPTVQQRAHQLALATRDRINQLTGLSSISPQSVDGNHEWIGQMVAIALPQETDPVELKARLFDQFRIEVPITVWNGKPFVRASFAAYNTAADADALVDALGTILA